ncbi:MAG TPA: methyltransferase [Bryobacteraceae bacterium]|nr:methyltransferase [Bryobacteraceae bacterium]
MASTQSSPHPLHLVMPRLGTDAEFAALRELLLSCGFTTGGICGRLRIPSIAGYKDLRQGREVAVNLEEPVDALIRLLLDGEFLELSDAVRLLPAGALETLEALNLAQHDRDWPSLWYATVTLYPVGNLWMVSDRASTPDKQDYRPPADVVYPAVVENTREFLATLPETPCDALLDIGTGTGIAALAAAGFARHVWGLDIAARSVRFAQFNQRLNEISNATMLEGDLYEPVEGLTFDRIVAHLPYVPARKTKLIYRDGGEDGEQILRRVVEGLPRFLRPSGRFYTFILGVDCEGETFEERIRRWLGPQHDEFDLVLVSYALRTPAEFISHVLNKGTSPIEDVRFWGELWQQRKVQFVFYGPVMIRRHEGGRPGITARAQKGTGFRREHVDWLLDWETEARDPDILGRLLASKPFLSPDCRMAISHRVQGSRFVPEVFVFESSQPFQSECRVQGWLARTVAACDGARTWGEHYESARQEGSLPPQVTEADFAAILGAMVSNGVLRIADRPLPAAE